MTKPRQTIRLASPKTQGSLTPAPLRLTPYAWRKLLFLRDLGPTEVGGFAISAENDLLLVEDICLIQQQCTEVTVKFDDQAVADHFDAYVDLGYEVARFARIWVHTHPGSSASPSSTDEETFSRCFGSADWAIMFILAERGETYARLAMNVGPGSDVILPVEIDFSLPFPASRETDWEEEYLKFVAEEDFLRAGPPGGRSLATAGADRRGNPQDDLDDWRWDPFYYSGRLEVPGERF